MYQAYEQGKMIAIMPFLVKVRAVHAAVPHTRCAATALGRLSGFRMLHALRALEVKLLAARPDRQLPSQARSGCGCVPDLELPAAAELASTMALSQQLR